MSFSLLGLDSTLLSNLTRLGYTEPTPVQREAIPAVLAGGDLLVSSQTGSGKTAAFVLPGLQRLRTPATRPGIGPRMLVLTPTRELALQVQKATHGYCTGQRLRTHRAQQAASPPSVPSATAHPGSSAWRAWLLKNTAPASKAKAKSAASTSRWRRGMHAASPRGTLPSTRLRSIEHRLWSAHGGPVADSHEAARTARSLA